MFLLTKNACHTVCSYATQCFGQVSAGYDTQANIAYSYKKRGKSFFDFVFR